MDKVRFGVIGLGTMGASHLQKLLTIDDCKVTALCDIDADKLNSLIADGKVPSDCQIFSSYRELIDSGLCDAVAVVTPHPSHLEISTYAFRAGLHVMCDKPITITAGEADEMIKCWKKSKVKFSSMFVKRTDPEFKLIKEWIQKGKLGTIRRVEANFSSWLRNQIYFNESTWRGTWKHEGAGLLLNQAPHNLDLLFWLFGDAKEIQSRVRTSFHEMETEDEVLAWIETRKGYTIQFYATTGEFPGKDYMEIVGTKGTLTVNNKKILFKSLSEDLDKFIAESEQPMNKPEVKELEIEIAPCERGHIAIFKDFIRTIREDIPNERMISPGDEGIHSVEWANAVLLSGFNDGKAVPLPVNRGEYDKLLAKLRKGEFSFKRNGK